MHILQALKHLIDDILLVDVFEDIGTDDGVEVGIHKVEDEVDVAIVFSSDHVLKADDVLVTRQFLEEDDLTEGALGVGGVLEGVEVLLQRDNLLGALVDGLPDNAVSALTYKGTVNMQFEREPLLLIPALPALANLFSKEVFVNFRPSGLLIYDC